MSFGRELADFADGFKAGTAIADKYKDWESKRRANDSDTAGIDDPFNNDQSVPQVGTSGETGAIGAPGDPRYRDAIASIESGGKYDALGPWTGDPQDGRDRAYGRYQVMGKNVPVWTKEALGVSMTPEQFLADPAAQDKVFDHVFGGYVEKFGERGAAQAWFGGPGSVGKDNRKDVLGTTIKGYGDRFISALQKQPKVQNGGGVDRTETGAIPSDSSGFFGGDTPNVNEKLNRVVNRAAKNYPGLFALNPLTKMVRSEADQKEMVDKGWSKTMNSKHRVGKAADLVPINPETGKPDPNYQPGYSKISEAMREAAEQEGVDDLSWGGDNKSFVDNPHWEVSKLELEEPTLFAASGGAIPSPGTVKFAQAGTVPAMAPGSVTSPAPNPKDKYTPTRAYTQPLPTTTGGAGQPRRVSMPTGDFGVKLVGGLTPSQIAWEKGQKANDVVPVAPKPAAVAPKPAAVAPKVIHNPYPENSWLGQNWAKRNGGLSIGANMQYSGQYTPGSSRWEAGGIVSLAKGGAIPSKADLSFEELLKQEKGNRDQAAKRFNAQRGGPTSSAYGGRKPGKRAKAHDPDGYFVPAKKAKTDKTKTSSTGADVNASYPYGGDTATQEYSELAPDELSTTPSELSRVPDPALSLSGLPKELGGPGNALTTDTESVPPELRVLREAGRIIAAPFTGTATPQAPDQLPVNPLQMAVDNSPAPIPADQQQAEPAIPTEQGAWYNGVWIPAGAPAQPMQGFARGGAIPDDGGPMMYADAGQGRQAVFSDDDDDEDVPEGRPEREHANVQATPKLIDHVRQALQGGQEYISRAFNLKNDENAIPTPESQQAEQEGHARFASGEGAATSQEIAAIDDQVDPDRTLSEGDRQMVRFAKTTQWYLQQGRKEDAAASAASLLQYGAQRFGQLSQLAATAYRHYQETGDPKDLQNTTRFMEQAYHMIPDGANVDIQVDPQHGLVRVQKTNADGEPEMIDISPDELPALLKSGMDNSMYWKQILSLADPGMARQRESQQFQRENKLGDRQYTEGREDFEHGREREEKLADEERAAKAKLAEEGRALEAKIAEEGRAATAAEKQKLFEAGLAAVKGPKLDAGEVDMSKVGPVLGAFQEADAAFQKDPENQALIDARNEAASRYADAVNGDTKQMEAVGLAGPGAFIYKVAQANVALPEGIQQAPDGKYYKKGANGKYIEVAPPAGS